MVKIYFSEPPMEILFHTVNTACGFKWNRAAWRCIIPQKLKLSKALNYTADGKKTKNSSGDSESMSIMIFNVNIYRTWKKNRILKIKWNKYNIIQFPQCLFEEISMEIFFSSFLHFFYSASLVRRGTSRPPQRKSLQLPHMLFIFIICLYVYILYIPSNSRTYR